MHSKKAFKWSVEIFYFAFCYQQNTTTRTHAHTPSLPLRNQDSPKTDGNVICVQLLPLLPLKNRVSIETVETLKMWIKTVSTPIQLWVKQIIIFWANPHYPAFKCDKAGFAWFKDNFFAWEKVLRNLFAKQCAVCLPIIFWGLVTFLHTTHSWWWMWNLHCRCILCMRENVYFLGQLLLFYSKHLSSFAWRLH